MNQRSWLAVRAAVRRIVRTAVYFLARAGTPLLRRAAGKTGRFENTVHLMRRKIGTVHRVVRQAVAQRAPFDRPGSRGELSAHQVEALEIERIVVGNRNRDPAEDRAIGSLPSRIPLGVRRLAPQAIHFRGIGLEHSNGTADFIGEGIPQRVQSVAKLLLQFGPLGAADLTNPAVLENRHYGAQAG